LGENVSFDVLIDKIRPAVFAVGDKKKGKERKGKGMEGACLLVGVRRGRRWRCAS